MSRLPCKAVRCGSQRLPGQAELPLGSPSTELFKSWIGGRFPHQKEGPETQVCARSAQVLSRGPAWAGQQGEREAWPLPVALLLLGMGLFPICPQPPADMNLAKDGAKVISLTPLELGPGRCGAGSWVVCVGEEGLRAHPVINVV